MTDLFSPPTEGWQRVSVRLRDMRRAFIALLAVVAGAVGAVLWQIFLDRWAVTILWLAIAAAAGVWGWFWAARNQAAWGYAENGEELYVTSGVMWRRLVVIPYGRMQFVDVTAGPVARYFQIATVTLHTASTRTAADIPGLPPDEATRLRNRLTELGEADGAGI